MSNYSNILLVAELKAGNDAAIVNALDLARQNGSQLTAIGVVETDEQSAFQHPVIVHHENLLKDMVASRYDEAAVDLHVATERCFNEALRAIERPNWDLVIRTSDDWLSGSPMVRKRDLKLLRECSGPIWFIRPTRAEQHKAVIAALDYDPGNARVESLNIQLLESATALAQSRARELHVVHAWKLLHEDFIRSPRTGLSCDEVDFLVRREGRQRQEWLSELAKRHCSTSHKGVARNVHPEIHVVQGTMETVVSQCARELEAAVLLMSTGGDSGLLRLVVHNSVEAILKNVDCSIIALNFSGRGEVMARPVACTPAESEGDAPVWRSARM